MKEQKISYWKFSTKKTTYRDRCSLFYNITSPLHMFTSKKKLLAAEELILQSERGLIVDPQRLRKANFTVNAIHHPTSHSKIPFPFRISSAPFFIGIWDVLMFASTGIGMTFASQTINQTYQMCLAYNNRSSAAVLTNEQLMKNYISAVSTSTTVAIGLNEFIKRTTIFSPAFKTNLFRFVPLSAILCASTMNLVLTRSQEVIKGTYIYDSDGRPLGISQIAGRKAVLKSAITRVFFIWSILWTAPMIMKRTTSSLPIFTKYPWAKYPSNFLIFFGLITTCMPACLALFPQVLKLKIEKIEKKFHGMNRKNGGKIDYVYYNRGM